MVAMTTVFVIVGHVLMRVGCEPAPMIPGFLPGRSLAHRAAEHSQVARSGFAGGS